MVDPHIAPRHPASIHGMHWRNPKRHFHEMKTFITRYCLARIDAGLSRRWLGFERRARISHQAAPDSKSAEACKALSQSYELQVLRQSRLSWPRLVLAHLRLAFTQEKKGGSEPQTLTSFFHRSSAALVPAQQGAQLHESCARIRDPGDKCGLDLRFTQPIATAMRFAPAQRLSPQAGEPAARHCDYAQYKSLRHHPGSLVQYAG
jgi:hypothetical protein